MAFLTGLDLRAHLQALRLSNLMRGVTESTWLGLTGKSSFRTKNQDATSGSTPGGGAQECYRRKIGGFYKERKHASFPA